MPVIIDLTVDNISELSELQKNVENLKKPAPKKVVNRVTRVSLGTYKATTNIYPISSIRTDIEALQSDAIIQKNDEISTVTIFSKGKLAGRVKTGKTRARDVIKSFVAEKNNIIISYPRLDNTKGLVIKPKASDLKAKRDKRTKDTWNITLTNRAATKYRNQLAKFIEINLNKEAEAAVKHITARKKPTGIEMEVASRLGISADRITLVSDSFVGTDLTQDVRAEARKMMRKDVPFKSPESARATSKLTYRTGGFIKSITAKVSTNDLIVYSFDRKYDIHEKPKGTSTVIRPVKGTYLTFYWDKIRQFRRAKSVTVRSRPILKEAIRNVALRKLNKKFKLERIN